MIVLALQRPLSRGNIRLASADPLDAPLVDPNYFAALSDLDRLVQGVRIAREIFASIAIAPWVKAERTPGSTAQTDTELRETIRQQAISQWQESWFMSYGFRRFSSRRSRTQGTWCRRFASCGYECDAFSRWLPLSSGSDDDC